MIPNVSDFLLDLHQSFAYQGFAKIINIAMGMPAVFAKPHASGSQHISSEIIAHIRYNNRPADVCKGF
jgi:hypothetical protein